MLRRPLFAALLVLAAPATAEAAPFGELPFQPVKGGVSCLRATGAPGELVAWAPDGARFVHATATGVADAGGVRLGPPSGCPVAAAQASGAGVVASGVVTSSAIELAVALREPGAGWGVPRVLRRPKGSVITDLAAAVSAQGDAVVIWRELREEHRDVVGRIRAIRRRAGGAFGAPETLDDAGGFDFGGGIAAGIGTDGGVVTLWSRTVIGKRSATTSAMSSIAAPGARFGAPVPLASTLAGAVALAVAPDGRALAVLPLEDGLGVAERSPGGAFGRVQKVGGSTFGFNPPAVALRPDGAALIAWGGDAPSGVGAVRRSGPGAFGPPIEIVRSRSLAGGFGAGSASLGFEIAIRAKPRRPDDLAGAGLRAVLAPDGRAVLSWAQDQRRGGIGWSGARVATLTADGSAATQVLGGPLRDAETVATALLENGLPVVAWGDNARPETGDGRLHLALEGAATPPPTAFPSVTVGRPERTVLHALQPLVLPVACSAACDVRASVGEVTATASLAAAGRTRLVFGTRPLGVARVGAARGRIVVASGPRDAHAVQTQVVRPRLRRIPEPPLPRIVGLRARRSGARTIDVRWRTDKASGGVYFGVAGASSRTGGFDGSVFGSTRGGTRRSFHVRLRDVPANVRYVHLVEFRLSDGRARRAIARVR